MSLRPTYADDAPEPPHQGCECPRCGDAVERDHPTLCDLCRREVLEWAEEEAAAAAQYREETGWKPKSSR